ncbi:MAG: adenylate/guanylate cyclase domain-containing protein, partial [Desulfosalsimonas sp.]
MKCLKCSFENPEGAKFCVECGNRQMVACPECGQGNSPGFKFCSECGHNLYEPAKPPNYSTPCSYTPKHLANKVLNTRSAIEGERKLVTVLFADVADYTAMSENLDPEEVHRIMDGCFKILVDEIHRYEGTINQFTGDGVMALFGAPVAHEDHAHRACYAGLSIQKALGGYAEKIAKEYGISFAMRIGLNSGPVIVGAIGDDLRMDYTAVGDTTNLASRMQALAGPGRVFLSDHTCRLVKDHFDIKPLGKLSVKGKRAPQEAFELVKPGKAASRLEASAARGFTRFVGRKNSMASLMEIYEKVKSGTGQVVGIVGEAGVGKSRLLFEFINHLPQGEFTYLEGRCVHYGSAMPYLPVLEVLRGYFGITEGEREFTVRKRMSEKVRDLDKNLADTLPPLQEILSLRVEDEDYLNLEPRKKKERIFDALRDLLVRQSLENPLILAIEDLHWVDKTTGEFLDYLIGWMANTSVMLLLLYRPEYTHQWGGKSFFNRIGLDQLTVQSSAQLVGAILEGERAAPELKDLILSRAAGNPLFMEELTYSLLENGSIRKKQDRYVLCRKPSELQVPDTVQGIISARMDRLEQNLKKIMQVASVIGREFAFRILQTIVDMREELRGHLINLQGLEFIYEKRLFPELEYVFKHALTQEVAYNSLLSSRRREIHKKIGSAIEELYSGNLEEFYEALAYHYTRGEEPGKAIEYLKLAGKKAAKNHALWEAYGFYREALELLGKLSDTGENKKHMIQVIQAMTYSMVMLGFPEDSLSFLQLGERLTRETGDTRYLAAFYSVMGHYYGHTGDHLTAIKYSEKGFEQACKAEDILLMGRLGNILSGSYAGSGQYEKVVEKMPDLISFIERKGKESILLTLEGMNPFADICANCGGALAIFGDFHQGKTFLDKALSVAVHKETPATLALTHLNYGLLYYLKGEFRPAKEHLEKSITHGEQASRNVVAAAALCMLGQVYSILGSPETGMRQAEKGLQIYKQGGIEFLLSLCNFYAGNTCLDLGDLEKAECYMDEAARLARKNNEKMSEGLALTGLGRVLGKKEPPQSEKAEECFSKGLAILHELNMKPLYSQGLFFLGEFYLDTGQKKKASENLDKAGAMFRDMAMEYWLAMTQTLL